VSVHDQGILCEFKAGVRFEPQEERAISRIQITAPNAEIAQKSRLWMGTFKRLRH
jgi:hypothetical protein